MCLLDRSDISVEGGYVGLGYGVTELPPDYSPAVRSLIQLAASIHSCSLYPAIRLASRKGSVWTV
jgi:hypothetical protein